MKIKKAIETPFLPKLDESYFDENTTPNGNWKIVDNPFPTKITAVDLEQQLFVKAFPPIVARFANLCHLALQELEQLELPVPVLAPTVDENGYHYFCLGSRPRNHHVLSIYSREQIIEINTIITDLGLLPSFILGAIFSSRAETVEIDGIRYLIDPIADDYNQLYEFRN